MQRRYRPRKAIDPRLCRSLLFADLPVLVCLVEWKGALDLSDYWGGFLWYWGDSAL